MKTKKLTQKGNLVEVKLKCELCEMPFITDWKHRNQRFCKKECMYEWRKQQNWEITKCLHCAIEFKRRKNFRNWRNNLPQQYCSNECNRSSIIKKQKLKIWGKSINNHWKYEKTKTQIKKTKLLKYGNENYNNPKKMKETNIKRYGVACPLLNHQSNGKTISKIQQQVYETVKLKYKSAKLEEYLKDVDLSIDIYIPRIKTVIEVNGDYWHMNPNKYKATDYNKNTHLTAKQMWEKDTKKVKYLQKNGYKVITIWETDVRSGKYRLLFS